MTTARPGGIRATTTFEDMIEVWWPGSKGDVLRAKFRSLDDAMRFVWRNDRVKDASVRFPGGEVRWAHELDAPPLPARLFPDRPIDGAKLARQVCERLPHLHEEDVTTVVRATLYVLAKWRGTASDAPSSQPATVREPRRR